MKDVTQTVKQLVVGTVTVSSTNTQRFYRVAEVE
jgi:hypothetical protein